MDILIDSYENITINDNLLVITQNLVLYCGIL